MADMCAFALSAPQIKKTPGMIELLKKKDKMEEEAEVRDMMRVAYAEAKAEAEKGTDL